MGDGTPSAFGTSPSEGEEREGAAFPLKRGSKG